MTQLPRYISKKILSAFKGQESSEYAGFYIVNDRILHNWLIKNVGMYSDSPVIELVNGTKIKFNWKIQFYMVSA
jgi:hypothetical protein